MGIINFKIILRLTILITTLILNSKSTFACTIVSGIDCKGHVWNANNEDGPFGVANFINVYPKTENTKYGYYTFSYFSSRYGQSGSIQGGMNEAGLTFDFNSVNLNKDLESKGKLAFPKGDQAILIHILSNMNSVEQVIEFFNTYWFQNGFKTAQMHVADRTGRFAIISASGIQIAKKGESLVSTNFDICGKEDKSSCWRFPIATSKINKEGASLETMISICKETAPKSGATMYSNIQNLTTGDAWFFSKHSGNKIVKTNIKDMLIKGRKSYSFSDLNSLVEERPKYKWEKLEKVRLKDEKLDDYTGDYENSALGKVKIFKGKIGIQILFPGEQPLNFYPASETTFFFPYEDIKVKFLKNEKGELSGIRFYDKSFWSFTATKITSN
ncbi:hypothetical protein AAON49_00925 [Pseudotenacibaculum sp. MALMAid0570]|uniref:hypothetical protein n=1 Tax=Pseudotenacibaculum sp. MALMAid0570 TaxID=3143938 RepID=UPI0032DF144C